MASGAIPAGRCAPRSASRASHASARSGRSSTCSRSARDAEREDRQPEVEVGPEPPLGHHRPQVAVGGAEQADVDLDRRRVPHPLDLPLLDDPQQLDCTVGRDVADLVEQQRAAVRLLEAPAAIPQRAGEGPLHVAEELALQQVLVERRAGDADERPGRAARAGVDRLGDALLPRPALPQDHHGRVGLRHERDGPVELLHHRVAPDQAARPGQPRPRRPAARSAARAPPRRRAVKDSSAPTGLPSGAIIGTAFFTMTRSRPSFALSVQVLEVRPWLDQPALDGPHAAGAAVDRVAGEDGAVAPDRLLGRPAGDPLGGPVPEGHAAEQVDGEEPVRQRVRERAQRRLAPQP